MDQTTRDIVRVRANDTCEYCQLEQVHSPVARLQIEHVRPKKHGGSDLIDNLALACIDCNLRKGSNLTGVDPESDQIVELFNPRNKRWSDHFRWVGSTIVGISDIGRTTVRTLDLNSDDRQQIRIAIGLGEQVNLTDVLLEQIAFLWHPAPPVLEHDSELSALTTSELLAQILSPNEIEKVAVVPLAWLPDAKLQELGISEASFAVLMAAIEIGKRIESTIPSSSHSIISSFARPMLCPLK